MTLNLSPRRLLRRLLRADPPPHPYCFRDNPSYDIQTALHEIYLKQADIVMLGDSSMANVRWNELLHRSDIANRGIGQDITAGMLARLDKVIALRPKIVFIMGGGNDIEKRVPIEDCLHNIEEMRRLLREAGIISVVISVLHASDARIHQKYNDQAARINRMLSMIDPLGIFYIDLNKHLAPQGYLLPQYALFDGSHLNASGYWIWKTCMEYSIKKTNALAHE